MSEKNVANDRVFKSKDLRRLSRRDLIILLLEQVNETERLKKELSDIKEKHRQEIDQNNNLLETKLKLQEEYANSQIEMLYSLLKNKQEDVSTKKAPKSNFKTFIKNISGHIPSYIKRRFSI